jgi:hypothetical protein
MTPEEQRFLRDFFRSLEDRPLDPDDPPYVGLYEDPALDLEDPVELLKRSIRMGSVEQQRPAAVGLSRRGQEH